MSQAGKTLMVRPTLAVVPTLKDIWGRSCVYMKNSYTEGWIGDNGRERDVMKASVL